jgi:hypothetical protein
MAKLRKILAALVAVGSIAGLAACGGGGSPTVARVGQAAITRDALDHWTAALGASDFYEHLGKRPPAGLIPDAPSTSSCVKAADKLSPPRTQVKQSRPENAARCRELYRAVRAQALGYLIAAQWRLAEGRARGIHVSDADVDKALQRQKHEVETAPGGFAGYLLNRGRSLADDRFELRQSLVTDKLIATLSREHPKQGMRYAFAQLAKGQVEGRTKTNCKAAYVVPECRQYRATTKPGRSPAVIMEEMSKF